MSKPELYPHNFEFKIGFSSIREELLGYCSSALGQSIIQNIEATNDYALIVKSLSEVREMINLISSASVLPSLQLVDCRQLLHELRPGGSFLEEEALVDLRHMLIALHDLHKFFTETSTEGDRQDESLSYVYPSLSKLYFDAPTFPKIEQALTSLLDAEGKIKDTASKELRRIRQELRECERSLSGMLARIVSNARKEGWIDLDVQPAMRDGRLVIPVQPQHKRRIKGIVHDESATGKTVYIEPVEMVEANNRIRELEGEERREIIRILIEIANKLRPNITHLLRAYELLAYTDAILAKARWARTYEAISPAIVDNPHLEWYSARHPLLMHSLKAQGREVVPLDIKLTEDEGRLLIISGPNAGGKSVCLKTVGLLQYMIQCGLPIPIGETSTVGIFNHFFIDIGDEQSLEDDLSTYSSHLKNMKHFDRYSDDKTLILIDEFGGGTEPTIGGAIAQALLHRFNVSRAYGVITTHYQNLKNFAEDTDGLINGAMLYDRHEMRPLFKLSIGRPGSSFAIEIARKIGLPEDVIAEASEIVGSEYIDMDKFLQDIIRDKRYWETKRQSIRKEERTLQEAAARYTIEAEETEKQRRAILAEARQEARKIVDEANGRIERTIKEIREAEAEREITLGIRQSLKVYQEELEEEIVIDTKAREKAQREVEKLLRRRERKQKGEKSGQSEAEVAQHFRVATKLAKREEQKDTTFKVGDYVRLDGQKTVASIISLNAKDATIALGMIKMTVTLDKLRPVSDKEVTRVQSQQKSSSSSSSKSVIDQIHDKRLHFKQDIDLRGMRVGEGVEAVRYYIDDAIQLGIPRVRILHGTGTGALKQAIREYLKTVRGVKRVADEHVDFGGAGITIVDFA